jgi:hypothetical protein
VLLPPGAFVTLCLAAAVAGAEPAANTGDTAADRHLA